MLATVTSKGQVTIPNEIRARFHIRTNDKLDFVLDDERILIAPVKTLLDLRGAVRSEGKGDFAIEVAKAKAAVALSR
jgi:AbrB family looped-hinge helix DNA binding protein